MKKNKGKKLLIVSSLMTAGVGLTASLSAGFLVKPTIVAQNPTINKQPIIDENSKDDVIIGSKPNLPSVPSNPVIPPSKDEITEVVPSDSQGYAVRMTKKTVDGVDKYVLRVVDNTKPQGVILLLDPTTGETSSEVEFIPGQTIFVKIKLNAGYEDHTLREIKVFGKNPNIFVPSKQHSENKSIFSVDMPEYDKTVDPETGESWLYDADTPVSIIPSFIKASIGANGNQVDWEHGGFYEAINGYVFNMTEDITWSNVESKIYETFKNDDATNPIDIFFYLNGNNLILDTLKVTLDIPFGWGLHIHNNKFEARDATTGKYGEIKVPTNRLTQGHSLLPVGGSLSLGASVKFQVYYTANGAIFIDYSNDDPIASIKNDPEARIGK